MGDLDRAAYKNPRLPIPERVADLLARMTVEEKFAQVIGVIAMNILVKNIAESGGFNAGPSEPEIPGEFREAVKYGAGGLSFRHADGQIGRLGGVMTA